MVGALDDRRGLRVGVEVRVLGDPTAHRNTADLGIGSGNTFRKPHCAIRSGGDSLQPFAPGDAALVASDYALRADAPDAFIGSIGKPQCAVRAGRDRPRLRAFLEPLCKL